MSGSGTAAGARAEQSPSGASPQLKHGALGFVSNVVIGVASTAPAYSLAATVGFLVLISGVGTHSPAVVVVSFIPLFLIAGAYNALNRLEPDCGTTFAWTTRALGPSVGWVVGWATIFSYIIANASQAQIAGSYGFQLFGLNRMANSKWDVIVLGIVFIVLLTWICWRGIEISARTQRALLAFELSILVVFGVVALVKAYTGHPAGSAHVSLDWFNPFKMSFKALIDGLLLGVFLYWGWDTGVSVNEESENSAHGPGRSAVVSTLILIAIYLLVTVAAQAYAGTRYLGNHSSDIFAGAISRGVLGSLHVLLTVAVLTSATAATQTTILPAARQALSMGRRGAIPGTFAEIHPRNRVPARATIWAGALSLIWFVLISILSSNVLADCIAGLGFLVCMYYGSAGLSCAVIYRHRARSSLRDLMTLIVMPIVGAACLLGVLGYGLYYYGQAGNDSSPPFLGLGVPDWVAIIGVGSGIILMLVQRRRAPGFFTEHEARATAPPVVPSPGHSTEVVLEAGGTT